MKMVLLSKKMKMKKSFIEKGEYLKNVSFMVIFNNNLILGLVSDVIIILFTLSLIILTY